MNNTTPEQSSGQHNFVENFFSIAGFSATLNPAASGTCVDIDAGPLHKLRSAGLPVKTLDEAHTQFKISPIRSLHDLHSILGYSTNPTNKVIARSKQQEKNYAKKYGDQHLTALAFQFPNPETPGETYQYSYYIRVRPNMAVTWGESTHKYEQPSNVNSASHSEPYFLIVEDQWTRIMSAEFPLIITEGELKAASLGLAGYACIGFPGAQMMYAHKKAGKNKLHPSLDPDGPRAGKTIPILDRDIYILPDSDILENKDVRVAFSNLIRNLNAAGVLPSRIRMIKLMKSSAMDGKVGIDDYLAINLGDGWAEDKVDQARELVAKLIEDSSGTYINDYLYSATSHIRGADRFLLKYDHPDKYLAKVDTGLTQHHSTWAFYNCDHYITYNVPMPMMGTSNRVSIKDPELLRLARELWDEGVRMEQEEDDATSGKRMKEMNPDFANQLFGIVNPQLPIVPNESLLETFEGVDMEDRCIRIRGALVNITKCFDVNVDWDQRQLWLLPPNYRWFGVGQIDVSLSNLVNRPGCPTFIKMVENMFDGDPERIRCLQIAMGKILLSPMFLDRNQFLAFHGMAGSGKSTITNLLIRMMGPADVVHLRSNFGGRFDSSELPGKRLIVFPENEDGSNHHFTAEMTATVKKVTGRDYLVCEKKGQQPIQARIDAEILIVGNAPPTIEMDEQAFLRRAVFLKATNKIENPDFGLSRSIMEGPELPGIFMWAMEGANALYHGEVFKTPAVSVEDICTVGISMSPEKRFVQMQVVKNPNRKLFMTEVEEAYRNWMRHNRLPAREPGWGKLAGAIREKFGDEFKSEPSKDSKGNSTRCYKGLTISEYLL